VTHELHDQLRDADPLTREPALSTDEVHAMRRRIVSAANAAPHHRNRPGLRAAGAVVLACTAVMVLVIATWSRSDREPAGPMTGPRHDEPRQLQFETPGGTRIIWVLNPNLEL
jgi:hypothetical protein